MLCENVCTSGVVVSITLLTQGGTKVFCPHMVKGRKHQKVSCEQWTVKDILIKCGFKYFLTLLTFLFLEI